jgi:hypothetical protein
MAAEICYGNGRWRKGMDNIHAEVDEEQFSTPLGREKVQC